jgi:hypothetical protein
MSVAVDDLKVSELYYSVGIAGESSPAVIISTWVYIGHNKNGYEFREWNDHKNSTSTARMLFLSERAEDGMERLPSFISRSDLLDQISGAILESEGDGTAA